MVAGALRQSWYRQAVKAVFEVQSSLWNPSSQPLTHGLDKLRNDTRYITSWANAGFSACRCFFLVNLIYLASISDRVPIIPPFYPDHHIPRDAGVLAFSDVFDVNALSWHMRMPILEWSDIKASDGSGMQDTLGCWSTRPLTAKGPVGAPALMQYLGLEAAYTHVPPWTRRSPDESDLYTMFWPLVQLSWPRDDNTRNLVAERNAVWFPTDSGERTIPDLHVACFDYLFYVTASAGIYDFEWYHELSPAWRYVGQHIRFSQLSKDRASAYTRKALDLEKSNSLPPYISVHIRRGDFAKQCPEGRCYIPLSRYDLQVKAVQQELLERRGLNVEHVIVSSDDTSHEFWEEIRSLGWSYVDHEAEKTAEKLGQWWSVVIDAAIQGGAAGFVGTDHSTVSLLSVYRVSQWNGGATRMVK
ncbi:hypothetical protein FISHEDRAFT_51260 [Fistulina hepatica ATCC 64428]|uniref:Uncharacterized protein n=1 Tax=Fistulina hepatica ATCC 64428 TaxID=1128425 RepID=A0A0D7A197_9AGAR|nr:hypothetical protein FISHEDRAFT_51260 [Fistulina hepatica ATCC 64428]